MQKEPGFTAKILASLDNVRDWGYSGRKLTALVVTVTIVSITLRFADSGNLPEVLIILCSFVALLLGMVTTEQLIRLKNGGGTTTEETKVTVESSSTTKTPPAE